MPKVTVLIPTYNCGKFILECLGSILRQSYTDYEILIIDDGSDDNTRVLVKALRHPKIRYYQNRKNLGIVTSLNKGLVLAKGEYIARMDADDIMIGNRLQDQIDFLDKNQEYGMAGGNYQVIKEDGSYLDSIITSSSSEFIELAIIFRNQFQHSAVTMRTALAKKLKYNKNFDYCEDHELWVRFCEISKVTNLQEFYVSYRWHDNNSCNKNQKTLKTSVLALLSRELDKIGIKHTAEELMLQGSVCFGAGRFMAADGQRMEKLLAWYNKIFSSKKLEAKYGRHWLDEFKKSILKQYSNVDSDIRLDRALINNERITKIKTKKKNISVLMPTYNQAAFITSAIKSLLSQSFTNWELIIIDDGSTDVTATTIKSFLSDPRITYIRNEVNKGLGYALNKGLDLAKHDLIAYLPSDDLYYTDHLLTLADAIYSENAIMGVSGIINNQIETMVSSEGVKSRSKISGQSFQLVQSIHAKTEDRWIEREEFVTADLDVMFWNKLIAQGKVCYTKKVTCEWVSHPLQRHRLIGSFNEGGIYSYKQYYNVHEKLRFHSFGKIINEHEDFDDVNTPIFRKRDRPLKILLVGELSLNPERIVAFEEAGCELYGLWMPNALGHLNSVGPFPFGNVHAISYKNYKEEIRLLKPDIIYGLLNYVAIPFVLETTKGLSDIPFVWHFKESPTYAKQSGNWTNLIELYKKSDGQIYLSEESKLFFGQYFDITRGRSILMDGDLPKNNFFKVKKTPLLSDADGAVHTVLPGRPYGLRPEDIATLSKHNIHFHFYGSMHQKLWNRWVLEAMKLAPNHFHVHPNCQPKDWTEELSKYDAGWMHMFPAENNGEIVKVTWNQLNLPARMPTLAAAGLPMLHFNDSGHISATFSLLNKMGIGLFFDSIEDLAQKLKDKNELSEIRENCWQKRMYFTFDFHVERLINFFFEVIDHKRTNQKPLKDDSASKVLQLN